MKPFWQSKMLTVALVVFMQGEGAQLSSKNPALVLLIRYAHFDGQIVEL